MTVTHPIDSERRIWVVENNAFRHHEVPEGHPERPDRLVAVEAALTPLRPHLESVTPRLADEGEILRIHGPDHFAGLREACAGGHGQLDPDTYFSSQSFEVARLAAGGTIDLARAVARGDAASGIAIVRPPGHHAESDRAMGFCLFNNVAIAARALQAEDGLEKILILDWDVHHGNGTQHSFEQDPSVLYVSTHQFPFYPGTGDAGEIGVGRGAGATLNIPMPAGCGDAEYLGALRRLLVPAARAFAPDAILVSCGFDAHREDFLASMDLSEKGFFEMTRLVRALAEQLCEGRIAFVLEGGYAATSLQQGMQAVLRALLEPSPGSVDTIGNWEDLPGSLLRSVLDRVSTAHGGRIPGLGAL